MHNRAVFLDLNGTLVMPVQVMSPDDYQPISGSMEAVRLLNRAGFVCPVVTVQSRIEKGVFSEDAFRQWFAALQQQFRMEGAELLGPYLCPHSARSNCECHKPRSTLYFQAADDLAIDCAASYVVGDSIHDIRAGAAIGAQGCFVRTGWADRYLADYGHEAAYIGADSLAVARWIVADAQ